MTATALGHVTSFTHERHRADGAELESRRFLQHSARRFRFADQGGVLIDPEPATGRMRGFLEFEGAA